MAEQAAADPSDMRVQYTFSALLSLGRILSRYPGPNLISVSESIPMNVFAIVTSKAGHVDIQLFMPRFFPTRGLR